MTNIKKREKIWKEGKSYFMCSKNKTQERENEIGREGKRRKMWLLV
jgi:hypothetical protein